MALSARMWYASHIPETALVLLRLVIYSTDPGIDHGTEWATELFLSTSG